MGNCPSNAELVELVEARLDAAARERLKEHVAGCAACAAFVDGLSSEEGREALLESGRLDLGTAQAILGDPTLPGSADPGAPAGEPAGRVPTAILERGTLVGRYLALSLIGRGGVGEVYAAYDPELDRRVALKLLHTRRGAESARARLVREARALGKLSHPNVVQVYDVGEHEGDVFLAMELVIGQPLGAFCKGPPRAGWQAVLSGLPRAPRRGLAAAHAQGIVHRDVKPANILRGKDGRVRVADSPAMAAGRAVRAPGRDGRRRPSRGRGRRSLRHRARALRLGRGPGRGRGGSPRRARAPRHAALPWRRSSSKGRG